MKQRDDSTKERKPYRKPQVKQIELVAEEQVLGGCKALVGDANPGNTAGCVTPTSCVEEGT